MMAEITNVSAGPLRIGLFGAGRVAQQLAPALLAAGHELAFLSSRTQASAQALAARLSPSPAVLNTGATSPPSADLYLLAVPDAAVSPLLASAKWPAGAVVAHVAGALPLSVFDHAPQVRGGVFYPLQTFSPGRAVAWATVPVFVEGAGPATENLLLGLARSLGAPAQTLSSADRLRLHIGAVFANNFTNHLLGIAHALLAEAQLPFALLAPLVRETADKALSQPPFTAQTGPAARRDQPTLAAHHAALAAHPGWQQLYAALTRSIESQQGDAQPTGAGAVTGAGAPAAELL